MPIFGQLLELANLLMRFLSRGLAVESVLKFS